MLSTPAQFHPPALETFDRKVPRHDVQWCRPVFRPPNLPTPQQLYREIPFSAAFPVKRFSDGGVRG